jgi:septum formation protein
VIVPNVAELAAGDPEAVVTENARRKLQAVTADGLRSGGTSPEEPLVIAADTIVVLDGRIYGKPADRAEAESMLRALAGRRHRVLTGVAVGVPDSATCPNSPGAEYHSRARGPQGELMDRSAVAITDVRFRALDERLLAWYLDSEEWRGRAGAYAIQARGAALVEAVYGDYLNVVGLPVTTLLQLEPTLLTTD